MDESKNDFTGYLQFYFDIQTFGGNMHLRMRNSRIQYELEEVLKSTQTKRRIGK
jgi:hypothetical protein